MKSSFPSRPIIGVAICILLSIACKKTNSSGGGDNPKDTADIPFPTLVGEPAGDPVSLSIGAAGGTLTSTDGRVQLVVPPGALTQATNITIQPITNQCPGGIGLAYDFLPNGTKFAVPASLNFHYTDDEVNGTSPLLLASVFQDSVNAWEYDDVEKEVDSVNKIVSFDVSHFTPRGFIPMLLLFASPHSLKENEISTANAQVWIVAAPDNLKARKYIQSKANVANSLVKNWEINNGAAGANDGTLSPKGSTAVYKAPGNIDKNRYINISCDVNIPTKIPLRGGTTVSVPSQHLSDDISLKSGVYSYDISMEVVFRHTSFFIDDVYRDGATMQVDIKYGDITISQLKNRAPTVAPALGTYGSSNLTWIPDNIGMVNVDKVTGTVTSGDDLDGVELKFTHKDTMYPSWLLTDNNGNSMTRAGFAVTGYPERILFSTKADPQSLIGLLSDGIDSVFYTVTPRH